jgi:hypothetical protein
LDGVRRSSTAGAGRLPVCAADRCLPHCSHPIHLLLAGKPYVGCRSQGDCCLHLRYTCVLLAGRPYVGYRSRRAQQMASCTFVSFCLLLAGRPHIGCPSRQIFHNDMIYPKLFRLTDGVGSDVDVFQFDRCGLVREPGVACYDRREDVQAQECADIGQYER